MKQLSALGARRAAFYHRRIRGPFETGPHNPDFMAGQIPFFAPQGNYSFQIFLNSKNAVFPSF